MMCNNSIYSASILIKHQLYHNKSLGGAAIDWCCVSVCDEESGWF